MSYEALVEQYDKDEMTINKLLGESFAPTRPHHALSHPLYAPSLYAPSHAPPAPILRSPGKQAVKVFKGTHCDAHEQNLLFECDLFKDCSEKSKTYPIQTVSVDIPQAPHPCYTFNVDKNTVTCPNNFKAPLSGNTLEHMMQLCPKP